MHRSHVRAWSWWSEQETRQSAARLDAHTETLPPTTMPTLTTTEDQLVGHSGREWTDFLLPMSNQSITTCNSAELAPVRRLSKAKPAACFQYQNALIQPAAEPKFT